MIDLTNKRINPHLLLQKFASVLETIGDKESHQQIAYVFDVAVKYINVKYPEQEQDWKVWCTVALKDHFLKYPLKFNNEKDIENYIDAFFKYHTDEYEKYLKNVAMYTTEYYRDYPFVMKFMKTQL